MRVESDAVAALDSVHVRSTLSVVDRADKTPLAQIGPVVLRSAAAMRESALHHRYSDEHDGDALADDANRHKHNMHNNNNNNKNNDDDDGDDDVNERRHRIGDDRDRAAQALVAATLGRSGNDSGLADANGGRQHELHCAECAISMRGGEFGAAAKTELDESTSSHAQLMAADLCWRCRRRRCCCRRRRLATACVRAALCRR